MFDFFVFLLYNYDMGKISGKLEKAVADLIKGKESWIAVQSFNPYTIEWFAKNAPEFQRGLLSLGIIGIDCMLHHKKMNPNFVSFQIEGINFIKNFAKKKGINLLTWTINTPEKLQAAINAGVNNVIFEKVSLDELEFSMEKLAAPVQ